MKDTTKYYAQQVQQALLTLSNTLLFMLINLWCSTIQHVIKNIPLTDQAQIALGYQRDPSSAWIAPEKEQLRSILSAMSSEQTYHKVVLLAAHAFAVEAASLGQPCPGIDQTSGYALFMQQLVIWLQDLQLNQPAEIKLYFSPAQILALQSTLDSKQKTLFQKAIRKALPHQPVQAAQPAREIASKEQRQLAQKIAQQAKRCGYLQETPAMPHITRDYFRRWCSKNQHPYIIVKAQEELLATINVYVGSVIETFQARVKPLRGCALPAFKMTSALEEQINICAEGYVTRANANGQQPKARWTANWNHENMLRLKNILAEDTENIVQAISALWPQILAAYEIQLAAYIQTFNEKQHKRQDPPWLTTLQQMRSQTAIDNATLLPETISLPADLTSLLTKEQIIAFLELPATTRELKPVLLQRLLTLLENDAQSRAQFFTVFVQELAVGPGEVEALLACTQTERRNWLKDGKLPILAYRDFRKAGQDLSYPVHDRRVILGLTQHEIERWRSEHQTLVGLRRKTGVQKALISCNDNAEARKQALAAHSEIMQEWEKVGSPDLACAFHLALWTQWASRWAKENQLKKLHAIKHHALYAQRSEDWYQRKNAAMRLLAKSPYARLAFYQPEEADKWTIDLCDEHYSLKKEFYYADKWSFYADFTKEIDQCPECYVKIEKNYYALYHLEISAVTFPELRFSFHIPYSLGKTFLPTPKKLPHVEHSEQDGLFRFGRSLFADEKILYREKDVEQHFALALAEMQKLYPTDKPLPASTENLVE